VMHVSQSEIDAINASVNAWEAVPSVPGIHKVHIVQSSYQNFTVRLWHSSADSSDTEPLVVVFPQPQTDAVADELRMEVETSPVNGNDVSATSVLDNGHRDISVGTWCTVQYDGSLSWRSQENCCWRVGGVCHDQVRQILPLACQT